MIAATQSPCSGLERSFNVLESSTHDEITYTLTWALTRRTATDRRLAQSQTESGQLPEMTIDRFACVYMFASLIRQ